MGEKYDLFTRLKNHKIREERTRREDFLTEVFALLLENVPIFFGKIINELFDFKIFDFKGTESYTHEIIHSNPLKEDLEKYYLDILEKSNNYFE